MDAPLGRGGGEKYSTLHCLYIEYLLHIGPVACAVLVQSCSWYADLPVRLTIFALNLQVLLENFIQGAKIETACNLLLPHILQVLVPIEDLNEMGDMPSFHLDPSNVNDLKLLH